MKLTDLWQLSPHFLEKCDELIVQLSVLFSIKVQTDHVGCNQIIVSCDTGICRAVCAYGAL
jgi:hypothetical protein